VATVITAVVAGLFILGSPTEERARRIDDRRVADLRGIVAATDLYWTRHSRLPASLDVLTAEPGVRISTGDPASLETYGYQPLDSARYEVCASFERESGETSRDPERGSPVRLPETRKGTSGHTGPGGSAFSSRPKKSSATRWDELGRQEQN
jgi:hypothetical protein